MKIETPYKALQEYNKNVKNQAMLESYSPLLDILPSLASTVYNSVTPTLEYGGRGFVEKNEIVHDPEGMYNVINSGSHAKNTDGQVAIGHGVLSDKVKFDKKRSFKKKFEEDNKEALAMSKKLSKQEYQDPITKESLKRTNKYKTDISFKQLLDQQEITKNANGLQNGVKEFKYGMKTYEFGGNHHERSKFNKWLYNIYAKQNPNWDKLNQNNIDYDPFADPNLRLAFSEYNDSIAEDPGLELQPLWVGEKTGMGPQIPKVADVTSPKSPAVPATPNTTKSIASDSIVAGDTPPDSGNIYDRIIANNILGGVGQAITYASNKKHALAQAAEDLPEQNFFEDVSARAENTLEDNAARIRGLSDIQRGRNRLAYNTGANSIQNRGYQTNAANRLSLFQALNQADNQVLTTELGALSQNAGALAQTQLQGDIREAAGATDVLANTQADIAANRDANRQADNLLGQLVQNGAGISNSNLADFIRLNMFKYITDGGSGVDDLLNNGK